MSTNRWPVITTSVSGIDRDIWTQFKRQAGCRGMTHREAAEDAINRLSASHAAREPIEWQPVRGALSHSIRTHEAVWRKVINMVDASGYRQNVIVLTAIKRWMSGD